MQSTSYDETTVNTAALLNTYMYLDNHSAENGSTVREILRSLEHLPEYGSPGGKYHESWELLNRAALSSFGDLILDHQSETMGFPAQTNACSFTDPHSQDIFIVYRGTADGEWPDNGAGLFSESTLQQEDALLYFDRLAENGHLETPGSVFISGHSKGGNKAQFVTLASSYSDRIGQCLSFDGQGFAPKAIASLQELLGLNEYEKRRKKLFSICGDNDFVNVLGCSAVPLEHTVYLETDPGAMNPAGYHDIKYLFYAKDQDGQGFFGTKLNPPARSQGSLALYVSYLSSIIMSLPEPKLAGCAMALTKLIELGGEQNVGIHEESVTAGEVLTLLKHGITLLFSPLPSVPEARPAFFSLPFTAPAILQGGALVSGLASLLEPVFSCFPQFSAQPLYPGVSAGKSDISISCSDVSVSCSNISNFPSNISVSCCPSSTPSLFLSFTRLSPLPALLHESLLYLEQTRRSLSHIRLIQCKSARNRFKRLELELAQASKQLKAAKETLEAILALYEQAEKMCSDGWFLSGQ